MQRTLLELAAKAAGIVGEYRYDTASISRVKCHDDIMGDIHFHWTALENDGDAFRLAVTLDIAPIQDVERKVATAVHWFQRALHGPLQLKAEVPYGADPVAATRMAVLRVAADIQRLRQHDGLRCTTAVV